MSSYSTALAIPACLGYTKQHVKDPETQSLCRSRPQAGGDLRPRLLEGGFSIPKRRIVAKVDELMALRDRLEASLDAAATRRRLLDALLAQALAPLKDREREAAE